MKDLSRQDLKQLESLGRLAAGHKSEMSPNDVLVQIMLPLVLILAVATRLMLVGQNLVAQSQVGPSVLDLWKQQLILRIDQRLERWERESELATFPDFERVRWEKGWPSDERFKRLCREAALLADAEGFAMAMYKAALARDAGGGGDAAMGNPGGFYDPMVHGERNGQTRPGFVMDEPRRTFALEHIKRRHLAWRERILDLQWKTVAKLAAEQPLDDAMSASDPAVQMRKFSDALAQRGYVLMPDIMGEYGAK